MHKLRITLLTGRTVDQGVGKECGKLSNEYYQSVTFCEIDPDDMKVLGIREGDNVKVKTKSGSVVLKALKSARAPHPKIIFIPYGPWANIVIDTPTHGTGMPSFKGILAEIEAAPDEKVLSLPNLLKEYYRKG